MNMEQLTWVILGKEYDKAVYCHPDYLTSMQSVCILSHFSDVWLFVTSWAVVCENPLSMGFSRQDYWSGLPFPSPGDLPDPLIENRSLASPTLAGGFFTTEPPGKPTLCRVHHANAGLYESQAGIKISGRNNNNLRYEDDTILMTESKEELKRLLMNVKEENKKVGLKLTIHKT